MRQRVPRERSRRIPLFVSAVASAVALLAGGGCGRGEHADSTPRHRITIGIQISPAMALVMVAQDKGFFRQHGLDVELKEFTAGKFALQAFLAGGVDFAVSGEVPVGLATLQGNAIRVVCQVVERTQSEVRVVALRDDDITDPAKYFKSKKRKLATSFGGGPEFFTYSFLKRYQIAKDEVEIISQKPEDMPAALAAGSVDAVAIFEPFAYFAEKRTKRSVVVFSDSSLYSELYVLNVTPEQIDEKSTDVAGVVRALVDAGDFVGARPEEAKAIVQKYTKLDTETIEAIWPSFVFRPALSSELVRLWQAEAEWARETGKVRPNARIPDFRTIIEPRFLESARPSAVGLR